MLDGHHALSNVGKRLEERGLFALRQPGGTRAALTDDRGGPRLDALCAAHLNRGLSAVALRPKPYGPLGIPVLYGHPPAAYP